jgi:hypothetical protein
MAITQVTVPYLSGYDFGVGADLASGSPMGLVVEGQPSGVPGAAGATASFDITRIHSTSELEKSLGIDVEASYGCAAFGAGMSARFSFAQKSMVQSSSLFLAITANVSLEFISIKGPSLTEPAKGLVGRPDVFSTRYGNMFVRGVGRGGLFVGVIQIDTSNSADSESISAELSGSYGLFSGDAKTHLDSLQKKFRSEIHISVYHEGGPVDLAMNDIQNPVELYELLVRWLQSLEHEPDKYSKPYYTTLAPIQIADGPMPPNAADVQHAQDVLIYCAKERSAILDNINLLGFVRQHPANYVWTEPTTPDTITQALTTYQADLDLVAHCASQAINDVTKAVTPADFAAATGSSYPKGTMPMPMPASKAGATVVVPDFSGCATWDACNRLAAEKHLNAVNQVAAAAEPGKETPFKVLSQIPTAGESLPEGSNVTVVTQHVALARIFSLRNINLVATPPP